MKIQSLTGAVGYTGLVREKQEGESWKNASDHHQEKHSDRRDSGQESSENNDDELNAEKLTSALDAFRQDAQTLASGLSAAVMGDGPGLKVILKDGTGKVLRQFTGEEFVKLRKSSSKDQRTSGKILDQKL